MSSSHERNDRKRTFKSGGERPARGHRPAHRGRPEAGGGEWLWGWHPVVAALANPKREAPRRLLASAERAKALAAEIGGLKGLEVVEPAYIAQQLPAGAAHQGVALKAAPLEPVPIDALGEPAEGVLLMLDQVTDPQNVGAIFRSAAAFGARGLILQDRHAPALTGALAKAAAGAVDKLDCARVTNLSRALEQLAELGWRAVGLDGEAETALEAALDGRPTVLVMGSEGEGIRRLVAEHCDTLARIDMPGGFESLNVSAAAAVALYVANRARSR